MASIINVHEPGRAKYLMRTGRVVLQIRLFELRVCGCQDPSVIRFVPPKIDFWCDPTWASRPRLGEDIFIFILNQFSCISRHITLCGTLAFEQQ